MAVCTTWPLRSGAATRGQKDAGWQCAPVCELALSVLGLDGFCVVVGAELHAPRANNSSCGLMDKAPPSKGGDCRFESRLEYVCLRDDSVESGDAAPPMTPGAPRARRAHATKEPIASMSRSASGRSVLQQWMLRKALAKTNGKWCSLPSYSPRAGGKAKGTGRGQPRVSQAHRSPCEPGASFSV